MSKRNTNPHTGSSFDDFLKEQNILDDVHAKAVALANAENFGDGMTSTLEAKRKALPYGLLKGKLRVNAGFDDPLPDETVTFHSD